MLGVLIWFLLLFICSFDDDEDSSAITVDDVAWLLLPVLWLTIELIAFNFDKRGFLISSSIAKLAFRRLVSVFRLRPRCNFRARIFLFLTATFVFANLRVFSISWYFSHTLFSVRASFSSFSTWYLSLNGFLKKNHYLA